MLVSFEKILQESEILLRPQRVGHAKLIARVLRIEFAKQRAHRRVKPLGWKREVKRGGHLRSRLTPRTGKGHGKRSRNALRRKEEIPVSLAQPAVEVHSEGVVAVDQCRLIGIWRRAQGWVLLRHRGDPLQQQKRYGQSNQRFHAILHPRRVRQIILDSRLRPAQVSTFAGVHADLLALIDEGGNLYHEASLQLGRLGHA